MNWGYESESVSRMLWLTLEGKIGLSPPVAAWGDTLIRLSDEFQWSNEMRVLRQELSRQWNFE